MKNVINQEIMHACPTCNSNTLIVCQDCAEKYWIPRVLIPRARYLHRDDYAPGIRPDADLLGSDPARVWKMDCWSVAIDENTGSEDGFRTTNCRQVPSGAVIFGSECIKLDGWTHWRLPPQGPIE